MVALLRAEADVAAGRDHQELLALGSELVRDGARVEAGRQLEARQDLARFDIVGAQPPAVTSGAPKLTSPSTPPSRPVGTLQRIVPWSRSTATRLPQGGRLQGFPETLRVFRPDSGFRW